MFSLNFLYLLKGKVSRDWGGLEITETDKTHFYGLFLHGFEQVFIKISLKR